MNGGYSTVLSGASPGGALTSCPPLPPSENFRGNVKYSKKAHPFESLGASGLSLLGLYLCDKVAVFKADPAQNARLRVAGHVCRRQPISDAPFESLQVVDHEVPAPSLLSRSSADKRRPPGDLRQDLVDLLVGKPFGGPG